MLQTALTNLTLEGTAEVNGTGWKIALDNGDSLYIDCGDEGFTFQVYDAENDFFSDVQELDSVSELKGLL